MGKLTGKGKLRVKVRYRPHTNMISNPAIVRIGEYKCRKLEMHLKLKDQQLKTILFIYRLLYQNLMITANQKSVIDTHTHTHKHKSNPNTTLKIVIKSQGKKRGGEEKRLPKTNPKQLIKWQ